MLYVFYLVVVVMVSGNTFVGSVCSSDVTLWFVLLGLRLCVVVNDV